MSDKPRSIAQRWNSLSSRTRMMITGGVTVVVLAAVIFGVSALSQPSNSSQPVVEITEAEQSQLALRKGLEALGSGDTTEAISLLEEALRLDPTNAAASDALERAREEQQASQSTGTNTSTGSGDTGDTGDSGDDSQTTTDPSEFLEPVSDLKSLLPVAGGQFSLGTRTGTNTDAAVPGSPADPDMLAASALWTVHDRETAAEAETFIDDVSKSLYGQDSASVNIDGAQAYFGTDGTRFATVTYVRGRYVFELVLSIVAGSPIELQDEAIAAASEFPDSIR